MSDLNVYASKIFSEHPIAIWPIDSLAQENLQYTSLEYPAYVEDGCTEGVPMVYGSAQSIRLDSINDKPIEVSQPRTWAHVKNEPDTGSDTSWGQWKNRTSVVSPPQNSIVADWKVEDFVEFDGLLYKSSIKYFSYGMFTNEGKNNSYTAEMWMRIDSRAATSRKIWGTLNTFDGLWVNDNYITLVVGRENKSYAVENWYRPMLVAVTYTPEQARLVINGQEVISLDYTAEDLNFDSLTEELIGETDLLGFATNPDIKLYEVDCFALYPYVVPDDVLKRRFVWGQGVREEAAFSNIYETARGFIDYPYAQYSNNVLYPDLYNWESGYLNNFIVDRQSLKTPDFDLPTIFAKGRNLDNLYLENLYRNLNNTLADTTLFEPYDQTTKPYDQDDLLYSGIDVNTAGDEVDKIEKDTFFTFQPEYDWDQPSYFYFNNINKLSEPIQVVYGVFENASVAGVGKEAPLMVFEKSQQGGDKVFITTDGGYLYYKVGENMTNAEELISIAVEKDTKFNAGFDINKLLYSSAPERLKRFFYNLADIRLYVGGNGTETYSGNIYKISIADTASASRNNIFNAFENDYGQAVVKSQTLFDAISSYTLMPFMQYGEFYLDVAAHSYWEENVALSSLGRRVETEDGMVAKLNFFQVNIGHDGHYRIKNDEYDCSQSELRTYIGFQRITDLIQKPLNDYSNTKYLDKSKVVEATNWENTKYEVINGTVVYPPADIPYYDLRVVIYFDAKAKDVIHSPLRIKNFSLAPQVYDQKAEIGTLYGNKFESEDAFAIYKEGNPYLYLTKDSGIEPLNGGVVRMPINTKKTSPYPLNLITFWIKPDFKNMTDRIFDIEVEGEIVASLIFHSDNGEKKKFEVESKNSEVKNRVYLYKNNSENQGQANFPIELEDNQWAFVGVEFTYPIAMASKEGSIVLHSGAVYQGVTASKVTTKGLASIAVIRTYADLAKYDYQYWTDFTQPPYNWDYAQLLTTENAFVYPISPLEIYNIYTGNNGFVVDDDQKITIVDTKGSAYLNVDWQTYDREPS